MREHDRQFALAVERPLACEALKEDAAERVDIGAAVDRSALDLLRRDVIDRPDEAALAGQAADGRDVASQAEVTDVCVFVISVRRDEDVPRLDVSVNEPRGMRCIERVGDLRDQVDCSPRLEPLFPPKQLAKIGAVDVRHREKEETFMLARGDSRNDVRVIEAGRDLRFAHEALAKALIATELWRKQFESDAAAGRDLLGEINGAHRALADERVHTEAGDHRSYWYCGLHQQPR